MSARTCFLGRGVISILKSFEVDGGGRGGFSSSRGGADDGRDGGSSGGKSRIESTVVLDFLSLGDDVETGKRVGDVPGEGIESLFEEVAVQDWEETESAVVHV